MGGLLAVSRAIDAFSHKLGVIANYLVLFAALSASEFVRGRWLTAALLAGAAMLSKEEAVLLPAEVAIVLLRRFKQLPPAVGCVALAAFTQCLHLRGR